MGALPLSKKDTPMRDLSKGKLAAGSSKPPAKARASGVVAKARESADVGAESSQDLWMQVCLECCFSLTLLFYSLVTTVKGQVMV